MMHPPMITPRRLIIAGSRTASMLDVKSAMEDRSQVWDLSMLEEVVSGCARGADKHGEQWARGRWLVTCKMPADWETHGKKAGPIRNTRMAKYADSLVAVWDGASRGTANMIETAKDHNLNVFVWIIPAALAAMESK